MEGYRKLVLAILSIACGLLIDLVFQDGISYPFVCLIIGVYGFFCLTNLGEHFTYMFEAEPKDERTYNPQEASYNINLVNKALSQVDPDSDHKELDDRAKLQLSLDRLLTCQESTMKALEFIISHINAPKP